ncbi:MAG: hypothetical protein WC495_06715 [Patescibacteria group bacterium]|jgi:3D (Asp-Asp-Asp) domain-containing protein
MSRNTKQFIWILSLCAIFTLFELALPIHVHAAVEAGPKLVVKRDVMSARLATSIVPQRNICDLIECKPEYEVYKTSTVVVTAYSSTPDQTSGDPFITACGSRVHEGTFAINGVPFGTQIRIPDYFGDKIFIVEDRMSSRYSSYRGDIWMQTREEAKQWGVRTVRIEFVKG